MKKEQWLYALVIIACVIMLFTSYGLMQAANTMNRPKAKDQYLVNHPDILSVSKQKLSLLNTINDVNYHLNTYKKDAANYLEGKVQKGEHLLTIDDYQIEAVFTEDGIMLNKDAFPSFFSQLSITSHVVSANGALSPLDKNSKVYKDFKMFEDLTLKAHLEANLAQIPVIKDGAALTVDLDYEGRILPVTTIVNASVVSYSFPYLTGSVIVTTDLLEAVMYIEYVYDYPLTTLGIADSNGFTIMNNEKLHHTERLTSKDLAIINDIIEKTESQATISGSLLAGEFQGKGVRRQLMSEHLSILFSADSLTIIDKENRQFKAVIHYDSNDEHIYKFYVNQLDASSMKGPLGALLYRIEGEHHTFTFVPYQDKISIHPLFEALDGTVFKEVPHETID